MSTHAPTIPAERLFWAVLDEPTRTPSHSGRPDAQSLLATFFDLVPASPDSVFVVTAPINHSLTLACGVSRESLSLAEGPSRLLPDALPNLPELATLEAEARAALLDQLNLLIGEFEHPALRIHRSVRSWIATLAIVALAAVLSYGIHARTRSALTASGACEAAATALLADLNLDQSQFAEALAHQRESRRADSVSRFDAAAALASLLSRWPTGPAEINTQLISVNASELTVVFDLARTERAAMATVEAPIGWKLEEPHLIKGEESTRVTLRYIPSGTDSR